MLGLAIVQRGGQITRLNDKLFLVKSGSTLIGHKLDYKVKWKNNKWTCQCKIRAKGERFCEHIHAVNFLKKLPQTSLANLAGLERACPDCGSSAAIGKGWIYNKSGAVQRFQCKGCGGTFYNPTGYENIDSNIALKIIVLDLFYKKLSVREISDHLLQVYGISKSHSTIHNWIIQSTIKLRKIVRGMKTGKIGTRWLADEMKVKVDGKWEYLWNILDYHSRYLIISILARERSSRRASMVIDAAIGKMGRKPKLTVTDGLSSYIGPLARHNIAHRANVGLGNRDNNNRLERVHGGIRGFIRCKRGMKGNARILLDGHAIYYNFARPHLTLGKNKAPIGKKKTWISLLSSKTREE